MKKILLAAIAACAIAAPASAATFIEAATIAPGKQQSTTINFSKFDPVLGFLNSVTLTFASSLDASGTLRNHSIVLPRSYLLSTGGIAALTGNGFNFMEGLALGLETHRVDARSAIGLDYSDTDSETATLTSHLGAFIGSGSVPFTFTTTSLFSMIGINGTFDIDPDMGGWAQITYDYTPAAAVPEPMSWALMVLGFGAAGGAMRRRRSPVTTTVRYA
jgi:hypothetical protein